MNSKIKELAEHITASIVYNQATLESEGLSSAIWEKYLHLCDRKVVKKGEYILEIGQQLKGLFFIKKGSVKSYLLGKDGTVKTIGIASEGCLFGEQFIFHDQPSLFEAMVLEDAELYFFEKDTILDIMQKDFEITLFILKFQAVKSRKLAIQIEDTCLRNIAQGICRILHALCCAQEKSGVTDGEIVINISHQNLADMLASHRVTITKNLNMLKKQGVLDYKYEKIFIKDRKKLKSIAFE